MYLEMKKVRLGVRTWAKTRVLAPGNKGGGHISTVLDIPVGSELGYVAILGALEAHGCGSRQSWGSIATAQ